VGLTPKRLTPAAEQAVSMAGAVCNSFQEAAGARVGQVFGPGRTLGFPQPWPWHRDAERTALPELATRKPR